MFTKFAGHFVCSCPVMVTVTEPLVAGVVPVPMSFSQVVRRRLLYARFSVRPLPKEAFANPPNGVYCVVKELGHGVDTMAVGEEKSVAGKTLLLVQLLVDFSKRFAPSYVLVKVMGGPVGPNPLVEVSRFPAKSYVYVSG